MICAERLDGECRKRSSHEEPGTAPPEDRPRLYGAWGLRDFSWHAFDWFRLARGLVARTLAVLAGVAVALNLGIFPVIAGGILWISGRVREAREE